MVPPESEMLVALASAVTVPPAQVVAPPGVDVVVRPDGKTSEKAAPVRATALELASVIVISEEAEPSPIWVGENDFETAGAMLTFSVSEAGVALVTPSAFVSALAGIVFVKLPEKRP